jgi:hypothetical protein
MNIKGFVMKRIFNVFKIVAVMALIGLSILGCDVSPEVVYPLRITITGFSNPPQRGQELLSVGIFANPEAIMPQEVLSGEMPKEDMMKKALAGGIAQIKDGRVVIELMDPVEQTNFTVPGEYYIALMVGESMDGLERAYVFINSDPSLELGMDAAMSNTKGDLIALLEGPLNPLSTLPTIPVSSDTYADLSEFAEVTTMFRTLFIEE